MKFYHLKFNSFFFYSIFFHFTLCVLLALLIEQIRSKQRPILVEILSLSELAALQEKAAPPKAPSAPLAPAPPAAEAEKTPPVAAKPAEPPLPTIKPEPLPKQTPVARKQTAPPPAAPDLNLTARDAQDIVQSSPPRKNNAQGSTPNASGPKDIGVPTTPKAPSAPAQNQQIAALAPSFQTPKGAQTTREQSLAAGKATVEYEKALFAYQQTLLKKVEKHWRPIKGLSPTKPALVRAEIKADGSLSKASIEKTSGSKEYDTLALNAVKLAAPFPPYPNELPQDKVFVVPFQFQPNRIYF